MKHRPCRPRVREGIWVVVEYTLPQLFDLYPVLGTESLKLIEVKQHRVQAKDLVMFRRALIAGLACRELEFFRHEAIGKVRARRHVVEGGRCPHPSTKVAVGMAHKDLLESGWTADSLWHCLLFIKPTRPALCHSELVKGSTLS